MSDYLKEVLDEMVDDTVAKARRSPGCRSVEGIPFERIVIDPAALVMAADLYASQVGDCDEVALGSALLLYLEAEEAR